MQSGVSCAMVLTASFALSLVSRACCHHRLRDHRLTGLISASGYQDHTTLPSAVGAFVCRTKSVHRIPHPTFVTIAKRPSYRGGTAQACRDDLPDGQSGIFFSQDWTDRITLILQAHFSPRRQAGQTTERIREPACAAELSGAQKAAT
jgi:hypothetical protein